MWCGKTENNINNNRKIFSDFYVTGKTPGHVFALFFFYRCRSPFTAGSGPGTLHDRKNFCFPPSEIALVLYWG